MSTEHTIWSDNYSQRKVVCEFTVLEHSCLFDLSINFYVKSETPRNDGSQTTHSNVCEIDDLNVNDLQTVCIRMLEILSYYHKNPSQVIEKLLEQVPEYRKK